MAKSQETWNKKEKENKKKKKREDKIKKKEERKANSPTADFESMLAYVDEFGNITSTPPDPTKKKEEINAEDIELGVPVREAADDNDGTRTGIVSYFDSSKGYGFIKDLDTQESVFTHLGKHLEEIKEGNKVTFRMEKGPKGMNAVEVRKAK